MQQTQQGSSLGQIVLCDMCNKDYTNSDLVGGILYGTAAYCPECAPSILRNAKEFNEEQFINAVAGLGEQFRHFVYRIRRDAPSPAEVSMWDAAIMRILSADPGDS